MNVDLFSISALAKLSKPVKMLIAFLTVLVCFVIVSILLIVVATQSTDALSRAHQREADLLQELKKRQIAMLSANKYEEAISEANEVLQSLKLRLPTSVNASNFLAQLRNNAKESGVTVLESLPYEEKPYRLGFMVEIPVEIMGCATYHQLGHFVANLSTLERIITLESFQMKQGAVHKNTLYRDMFTKHGGGKSGASFGAGVSADACSKYSGLPFRAKITTYRYID